VANKTRAPITDVGVAYNGFAIHTPVIHDDAIGGGWGWNWPRPPEVPPTAHVTWSAADGSRHERDLSVAAPAGPVPTGHRGRIRLEIHRGDGVELQYQPPSPKPEIAVTAYNASPSPIHNVYISPGGDKTISYNVLPPKTFPAGFSIGIDRPAELVTVQWLDATGIQQIQSIPFAGALPRRRKVTAIVRFDKNGSVGLVTALPGEGRTAILHKLNRP
jgi:hypothetical protein